MELVRKDGAHADLTKALSQGRWCFGKKVIALTPREVGLVRYLFHRVGQTVSRSELLREVWGYAEGVNTRAVDLVVRRVRSKIEADPANPRCLITVYGEGYRLEIGSEGEEQTDTGTREVQPLPNSFRIPQGQGPLVASEENCALGGIGSGDAADGQVPSRAADAHLFGRDEDVGQLRALIGAGQRLITVLGPPGVGKTRVALKVAADHALAAEGQVTLVELSTTQNAEDIVASVGEALQIPISSAHPSRQVGHALDARGPMLLVLDNFEQVTRFGQETIGYWLDGAPQCCFLVTSRHPLHLPGEICYELLPLDEMSSLRLFEDRARRVTGRFALSDQNRLVVAGIVQRLDGLPLAIELAAARIGLLSPDALLRQLEQRFRLLKRLSHRSEAKHQTLWAALSWSWNLLEPWEKSALAQCSVFAGGFSLEAFEVVVSCDEPDIWMLDVLQSLRDQCLVQRVAPIKEGTGVRFRLLESVQAFVREKLEASSERIEVASRHADHFLACGECWATAGDTLGHQALRLERENLEEAFWFYLRCDLSRAVRIEQILEVDLLHRGNGEQCLPRIEAALKVAEAQGARRLRAWLLLSRALSMEMSPRQTHFTGDLVEAQGLLEEWPDSPDYANFLCKMGILETFRGQLVRAAERFVHADRLYVALGQAQERGRSLAFACLLSTEIGDLQRASAFARELELRRVSGATAQDELWAQVALARYRSARGELGDSGALLSDQLHLSGDLMAPYVLALLAEINIRLGNTAQAEQLYRDALQKTLGFGLYWFEPWLRRSLASVHWLQGKAEEAFRALWSLQETLQHSEGSELWPIVASELITMGIDLGYETETTQLVGALRAARPRGPLTFSFLTPALALGYAAMEVGNFGEAETCLAQVLEGTPAPHPGVLASAQLFLTQIQLRQGRPEAAARALEAGNLHNARNSRMAYLIQAVLLDAVIQYACGKSSAGRTRIKEGLERIEQTGMLCFRPLATACEGLRDNPTLGSELILTMGKGPPIPPAPSPRVVQWALSQRPSSGRDLEVVLDSTDARWLRHLFHHLEPSVPG